MTRPPLFRDLTLESAQRVAKDEGKLLLVDIMGDWCAPCRHMDATTWRAAEVETWVAAKAIAVQIDSMDPSVQSFAIKTVPTLMLFRDDTLLDRIAGTRNAEALLSWLARAERGEKEVRELVEAAHDDIHGRRRRVSILLERSRIEEAVDELAWIWEHALEVGKHWVGVRHSYVVDEIRDVVGAHPSARAKFSEIRERTERRLPHADAIRDWLDLNRALGDETKTLDWIERVKTNPPAELNVCGELTLFELLVRRARWADLGLLIRDPLAEIERAHKQTTQICAHYDSKRDSMMRDLARTFFRTRVACLHYALRAAARIDDTARTAARAKELDPSIEMSALLESPEPPKQLIER